MKRALFAAIVAAALLMPTDPAMAAAAPFSEATGWIGHFASRRRRRRCIGRHSDTFIARAISIEASKPSARHEFAGIPAISCAKPCLTLAVVEEAAGWQAVGLCLTPRLAIGLFGSRGTRPGMTCARSRTRFGTTSSGHAHAVAGGRHARTRTACAPLTSC
jgi:hypothetical protein